METIILGLGSNRGDSKTILSEAIKRLASFLSEIRISSIYITKPQDYFDQDDFYNMVVSGNYAGSPASLLKALQHIEADYGRNREAEIPKGPRTLDIDILFFGSQIITLDNPPLIIPHPAIYRRAFPCWNCILTIVIPLRNNRSPPHSLPYPIKACEKVSE